MPIKIIDRYIIRELTKIFLISVGSLTMVLYLDKFLFIAEMIVNRGVTIIEVITNHDLHIPIIFSYHYTYQRIIFICCNLQSIFWVKRVGGNENVSLKFSSNYETCYIFFNAYIFSSCKHYDICITLGKPCLQTTNF